MSPQTRQQLQQEVDLIGRFTESYRRKFSVIIERLNQNQSDASTDLASLRLCVEAVDMILSSQSELARVLGEFTQGRNMNPPQPIAA
jgi:hypothetical protein